MNYESKRPIEVLFDATILAAAATETNARTGVYRVASELAKRLDADPRIRLAWLAPTLQIEQTLRTEISRGQLAAAPIIPALSPNGLLNLPARALRKAASLAFNHGRPRFPRINWRQLRKFDIVYSPVYALPNFRQQLPQIRCILNVNDLIPILFPELLPPGLAANVKLAIDSLTTSDSVICVSDATRDDLLKHSPQLDPSRVHTIHLAASSAFKPCSSETLKRRSKVALGIPADATYILSVCTLEPRKNLAHVIRCFTKLVESHDSQDLYLVLVGSHGWQSDDLLRQTSAFARSRIIMTGYVPDAELSPLYSGACMFVYMSLYEGFGLPPLEAMQCGTPVIAANNSSLPEVIGDAGILIPASDETALIASMSRLLRDADARTRLSEKGLERSKRFDWERCADQTIRVFESLMSHRPRPKLHR